MNSSFTQLSRTLTNRGWHIAAIDTPIEIPKHALARYSWLPADVNLFLSSFRSVVSNDEKSWLVTSTELTGDSNSSFAWNQWEIDSLAAAEGDGAWQETIKLFWDCHFPVLLSVKTAYAYVAIRKDLAIVTGEEPEYEETKPLATTFMQFLDMLSRGDSVLSHLV